MHMLRTIRNCTIRTKAACPKRWEDLDPTDSPGARHCPKCDHDVYFCASDEETLEHARAGHCIAREEPDRSELPRLVIGRLVKPLPEPTDEQKRALWLRHREHGIDILLNGRLDAPSRPCADCAYPVPNFRKSCYVCGLELGRS